MCVSLCLQFSVRWSCLLSRPCLWLTGTPCVTWILWMAEKNDGDERSWGTVCRRILSWKSVGGDCKTARGRARKGKIQKRSEVKGALSVPMCILICIFLLKGSCGVGVVLSFFLSVPVILCNLWYSRENIWNKCFCFHVIPSLQCLSQSKDWKIWDRYQDNAKWAQHEIIIL